MRKLITIFLINIILGVKILAVPANPNPIKYSLPDGTKITITLKGDERIRWATSEDGYTLLLNKDGYYEYAVHDEKGNLVLSGKRAKNITERSRKDNRFLKKIQKDLFFSSEQVENKQKRFEMPILIEKQLEKSN